MAAQPGTRLEAGVTAPERMRELENEIGCFFDRNPDGSLHGKAFAGQTFDRTVHKGDLTGIEIISRLMEQVWERTAIRKLEEHRAVALIPAKDGRTVSGVLMIDIRTGNLRFVQARAVLMATGGGPTMYRYHTPSGDKSMDGLAMALRAGLPLRDMEMVQFHPTGLLAGPDTRMTGTVLEEGLRGAGGYLLDGAQTALHGVTTIEKLERATRDVVSRAIYAEMKAGRTSPNGGVYIEMGHLGRATVAKEFKGMVDRCRGLRFRPRRRPGRGGADSALFHGRPHLSRRHVDRNAGAVCRRRRRERHARGKPAGRQRGCELDGVRRHRGRRHGRMDRAPTAAIAGQETMTMPRWRVAPILSPGKPGDLNGLRERLMDVMWDDVGVMRDGASLDRGIAALTEIEAELLDTGIADTGARL